MGAKITSSQSLAPGNTTNCSLAKVKNLRLVIFSGLQGRESRLGQGGAIKDENSASDVKYVDHSTSIIFHLI